MALNLYNAIFRRLAADATVAALVATDDGPAIWEGLAQDGVFPNIAIEVEEQEDDAITEKTAQHYEVSINACALTPSARSDLHDAIKASLNRQQWTDQNVAVVSTLITSENRSADAEIGNPEQTYHISDISLSVIAEVATTESPWPFDTDFDFPEGALTGNDGWTTSGTASSALVTTTGLGPVDALTAARNVRTLPSGAPLSNGPFYLGIGTNGFGGDGDQTIDVVIYASSVAKISITLHFNSGSGALEYGVTTPASPIPLTGSISGYLPGDDLFVLSQMFGSLVLFSNNSGPLTSLVTFSVGLTTLNSVSIGITDASTEQSARISRVYFGAIPIT